MRHITFSLFYPRNKYADTRKIISGFRSIVYIQESVEIGDPLLLTSDFAYITINECDMNSYPRIRILNISGILRSINVFVDNILFVIEIIHKVSFPYYKERIFLSEIMSSIHKYTS